MRAIQLVVLGLLLGVVGCGSHRKSSLLLERPARGPLEEIPAIAHSINWQLTPETQTFTQQDVEVSVTHASQAYLQTFFSNTAVFKEYAGKSPYHPVHLVFYVNVANHSAKKTFINPAEFILLDDHGNQYHALGQDYITAFAESRQGIAGATRNLLKDAKPGYFGFSVPVGNLFAQKPIGQFALLLQSALKPGPLFPGAVYDGLIAFWSPAKEAQTLHLFITNVKTDFDAEDQPKTALDFVYTFRAANP